MCKNFEVSLSLVMLLVVLQTALVISKSTHESTIQDSIETSDAHARPKRQFLDILFEYFDDDSDESDESKGSDDSMKYLICRNCSVVVKQDDAIIPTSSETPVEANGKPTADKNNKTESTEKNPKNDKDPIE